MREAVARFVPDGASVCTGTALGFLSTLGSEALEAVRVKTPRLSEPLDYGA
jgi:hypothetical protein